MLSHLFRPALLGAVLSCAMAATAVAEPQRPGAADPAAPGKTPIYHSAFSAYQPMLATPPQDWRAVNEAVARTGGHAGALKEPEPPAAKPDTPSPAGHAGHKH